MRAKKSLGQHFLMHPQITERIVEVAGVSAADTVLEIGPGTGILTRALMARAKKVIAVEADTELVPLLEETFAPQIASGCLRIISGDIRTFDPTIISGSYKLVANIPYYITGDIIRQFLTTAHKPESMTLLVQKEVAERIARSKKESVLSLSVKVFGVPKYQFTVPKGAFKPAPGVDSAVLTVSHIRTDAFPSQKAEERFFDIVRAGFAHKRKLLVRNLEAIAPPHKVNDAFVRAQMSEKVRAEDVLLPDWQRLAAYL
ncbi:16S rRNA (adenine(1518)-N(6)/adenine(1519)-N(6))-dimethyltransferase RsmA [Candidatus Parcubacteria bacterium]|nr:16S rRNA (adenine(1518)-N(6)/adenine(1519)-N(6))-dimethyltransferase RsmA [Candidatus Parcubacteria bacterium]